MGVLSRAVVATCCAASFGGVTTAASARPGDRLDRAALRLTFAEEFDGPLRFYDATTKQGIWKTNWFYGDQKAPSSRVTGDDVAVDRDYAGIDPFRVDAGRVSLLLERNARRDDARLAEARYTNGLLTTERSFNQRYGYFEAKLTMPGVAGTWPAFWLYSAPVGEWVGGLDDEIDVVEGQGVTPMETLHSIHRRHAWKADVGGARVDAVRDLSFRRTTIDTREAHVYGVRWDRRSIVWYVDDVEVARTANAGFHAPMYMIVSMGSGGWGDNVVAPTFTAARLDCDFVRVYASTIDAP